MALSKVAKVRAELTKTNPGITARDGANPTEGYGTAGKGIDQAQQDLAGNEDTYLTYIAGGNDVNDYTTDGDFLRQAIMKNKLKEAYLSIYQKDLVADAKSGTEADKGLSELAKG